MSKFGFDVELAGKSVDEAVEIVTAALKEEGFGVLTEIDVKATLKKKIDVDFRPYRILGACNPKLAHKALSADPSIGLFLPCNVVVEEIEGGAKVQLIDPNAMFQLADIPALEEIAADAEVRFKRVAAALA